MQLLGPYSTCALTQVHPTMACIRTTVVSTLAPLPLSQNCSSMEVIRVVAPHFRTFPRGDFLHQNPLHAL